MNLNEHSRRKILDTMIEKCFGEREQDIKSRIALVVDKAYEEHYGEKEIRRMSRLPKGTLEERRTFDLRTGRSLGRPLSTQPLRVWHKYREDIGKCSPETKEAFIELCYEKDRLMEEIRTARRSAKEVLKSVRTVKQLVAIWPEAEAFVPKDPAANLPTLRLEKPERTPRPLTEETKGTNMEKKQDCPFCDRTGCVALEITEAVDSESDSPFGEVDTYAATCESCGARGPTKTATRDAWIAWHQVQIDSKVVGPCRVPWCNGTGEIEERSSLGGREERIVCESCGVSTPWKSYRKTLLDTWFLS